MCSENNSKKVEQCPDCGTPMKKETIKLEDLPGIPVKEKKGPLNEKRLEWLFRERKARYTSLKSSFVQYAFIIFLYILRDTFGWWWLIYMLLYIAAILVSPSERKVQKEINKELGLDG